MKIKGFILIAIVAFFSVGSVVFEHLTSAQLQDQVGQGSDPYQPTKSEWLALSVNAALDNPYQKGFVVHIDTDRKDTITIGCVYAANTDKNLMNETIKNIQNAVEIKAKYYGWEHWVKIEVKYKMLP